MTIRHALFFLAGWSVLWTSPSPSLWAQTTEKSVRKDAVGDPLPDGAVLRVGTMRLRHLAGVRQIVPCADGRHLASLSADNLFSLWDLTTGKEVRRYALPDAPAISDAPLLWERLGLQIELRKEIDQAVNFFPGLLTADGKTLVVSHKNNVLLLDPVTGHEQARIPFKEGRSGLLALAPGGKALARFSMAENRENELVVVDVATGQQKHKLRLAGLQPLSLMAFSPDGKRLAAADSGNQVALWDLTTGKRVRLYQGHEGVVSALLFAPAGDRLITGATDGVYLWDFASDEETAKFPIQDIESCSMAISPDGALLATSGKENSILVWDVATGTTRKELAGNQAAVSCLAFARNGKALLSGSSDGTLRQWDLLIGKESTPVQHQPPLVPVSYLNPGVILAHAGQSAKLQYLNAMTGKVLKSFADPPPQDPANPSLGSVLASPNGRLLALTDQESGIIRLWDVEKNKEWQKLESGGKIMQMAFSPDSAYFAALGMDRSLRVWSMSTAKEVRHMEAPFSFEERLQLVVRARNFTTHAGAEQLLQELVISRDNRYLACAGPDGMAYLWEMASGKERSRFALGSKFVSCLALSPDNRLMASVANDDTIRIWDTMTGKLLYGFVCQEGEIRALAFSNSGKVLAAGGASGTVFLFDLAQFKEKRRFVGHRGPIQRLLFAPDETTLLSAARDGTLLFWDVNAPLPAARPRDELDQDRLGALWARLGSEDAADAFQALGMLRAHPAQAVKFLKQQLRPIDSVPEARIGQLVANLDHARFLVRDRASQELVRLDVQVIPALQKALGGKISVEASRRIHQILEKLEAQDGTSENLRAVRAVELLEHIADADSLALLQTLAGGAAHARLTLSARDALRRAQGP
jgi:WD40 repeat protein